jgi:Fe-S cluster assembly protein SufD
MDKTNFTKLFAEFDRDASPRFRALRESARARFMEMPWPTTRTEDWRFTNVAPILEMPLELPIVPTTNSDGNSVAPPVPNLRRDGGIAGMHRHDSFWLYFVNGRLSRRGTSHPPDGLRMGSLANPNADLAPLGQIASEKENTLTALNTTLLNDGAYVIVPDGMIVEKPFVIHFLSQTLTAPTISNPRTLIVVGKNAKATVIERYDGKGSSFTNAVTEISLGEGAELDHVKVQDESTTAYHIANTSVVMAANSNFTTHYLSLGGALVRNEIRVRFDGEHAEATVNGLYMARGKQHIDNFTVIDHAKPNCASHELYKGILDEQSHGVFNGKIFVRKDAQKTDAKQTNKVLLLSDDATINTKPQLEIFADDVKCTHGATVGQLDPTQMFYLQSRGIPQDAARRLLTFAFANDIVNRLKIESLREELEARIVR